MSCANGFPTFRPAQGVGVMIPDLLTDYELMILLATRAAGGRAHGAAIACELQQRGCRRVVLREIHTALDGLERNGLVVSAAGGATSPRRRSARRAFEVTPGGLRASERKQQALVSLWAELPELEDQPLVGDLVWEHGAHRLQTWLWYLAQRV